MERPARAVQQVFLYGSGEEEIQFRYDEGGRVYQVSRVFEGVIPEHGEALSRDRQNWIREEFERFQNNRPCGACEGYPPAAGSTGGEDRPGQALKRLQGRWCRCRSARRWPGSKHVPNQ